MRLRALAIFTLLYIGVAVAQSSQSAPDTQPNIDWNAVGSDAVAKLRDYIRLNTTNPPGNESIAVRWFEDIFRKEGIPFESAESAPGRGNIVARLKGAGNEPALILVSHMDVVPINRESWSVDPFAAEVRDGYMWGRGTVDMKSLGIAELEALLLLHRNHVPLRRDVIFLATADEEAGGEYGAGWVVKNRPDWIGNAGFLINEASRAVADSSGKPSHFLIGETEKTPAWLKLTATGRAGHGAVPNPDSAANHLVAALNELRTYRPPLQVTPPVEQALRTQAAYEPEPWRSRFQDMRTFIQSSGAYDELAKRPPLLALLINTINITGLTGSNKINIVSPTATALLDCRLLPGTTIDQWVSELRKVIHDDSVKVDVVLNFPPNVSPVETPLHRTIVDVVKKRYPSAGMADSVEAGFTDSHYFRERNIVSYGFGPFPMSEADRIRIHGNDERIPLNAYTDGLRLLWDVVYEFSRAQ